MGKIHARELLMIFFFINYNFDLSISNKGSRIKMVTPILDSLKINLKFLLWLSVLDLQQ